MHSTNAWVGNLSSEGIRVHFRPLESSPYGLYKRMFRARLLRVLRVGGWVFINLNSGKTYLPGHIANESFKCQ